MTDPSVQMADPVIQCNPMTARGSFLQVSGLQLQPRVGGGRSGRDTGLTGRLHSRRHSASMRLCCTQQGAHCRTQKSRRPGNAERGVFGSIRGPGLGIEDIVVDGKTAEQHWRQGAGSSGASRWLAAKVCPLGPRGSRCAAIVDRVSVLNVLDMASSNRRLVK